MFFVSFSHLSPGVIDHNYTKKGNNSVNCYDNLIKFSQTVDISSMHV